MKNKIIERALLNNHDDRLSVEWLMIFAWILENCSHDKKCKTDFENLLIKIHQREVEGIADFDVPEISTETEKY